MRCCAAAVLVFVLMSSSIYGQITGVVTDTTGNPLANAIISDTDGKSVISDDDGTFTWELVSVRNSSRSNSSRFSVTGSRIRFKTDIPGDMKVSVFELNGKTVLHRKAKLQSGTHGFDLAEMLHSKHLSCGMYVFSLSAPSLKFSSPLMIHGRAINIIRKPEMIATGQLSKKANISQSSLKVERKGYIGKSVSISADAFPDTVRLVPSSRKIVVATASVDFSAGGNVSILDADDFDVLENITPIHADNHVRTFSNDAYILERYDIDNVIRMGSDGALEYQQNVGTGVNVQDIAFANDTKAFVTLYQSDMMLVFDPENGVVTDSIDLSAYVAYAQTDSAEQFPFAGSAIVGGEYLFVACQRLDGATFGPGDTSLILVIDTSSNEVIKTIALDKKNPVSMDAFHNSLYVSSVGSWFDPSDGGIERIDLTTLENTGVVLEEQLFGGNISTLVAVSNKRLLVSVGKNSEDFSRFWNDIVPCNPQTGDVETPISNIDNAFGGVAYDGIYIYIGDRSESAPGIVVINPRDYSVVQGPISAGLPPSSISVIEME